MLLADFAKWATGSHWLAACASWRIWSSRANDPLARHDTRERPSRSASLLGIFEDPRVVLDVRAPDIQVDADFELALLNPIVNV
jgi:hypothetical protein